MYPPQVAGINLDSDEITLMSASDSATAVLTRKHHAFVCTGFIVKHIRYWEPYVGAFHI